MEAQSGYVTIDGLELGATLSVENDRLRLVVTNLAGANPWMDDRRIELLHFRGVRNGFTLVRLMQINSNIRFGVGSTSTFSVQLAIEDILFDDVNEIASRNWLLYVEDLAQIAHVTGLQEAISVDAEGRWTVSIQYAQPTAVALQCPSAGMTLHLGQDAQKTGDAISGPTLKFRYPVRVEFSEPVGLYDALRKLTRVRFFLSLLMGRVLGTDEISIRWAEGDQTHDAKFHGLLQTDRQAQPKRRLVPISNDAELALLLDRWLKQYDVIADAVHLHMEGLERHTLPTQLRFQLFVQALEALHRRVGGGSTQPIDVSAVTSALRTQGLPIDVLDRVAGVLAHAHEPGLRQRLKHYWDQAAGQLAVLRPGLSKGAFVNRVVATRNHFAHRTDSDDQVLSGAELWDATETIKVISHIALIQHIGGSLEGVGQAMFTYNFVDYIVDYGLGES